MRLLPSVFQRLMDLEGFRAKPYDDGAGNMTIGYGHTRSPILPAKVSEEEAQSLLIEDVMYMADQVTDMLDIFINENEYTALVMLCFNIGPDALRKSTLMKYVNQGEMHKAAKEFDKWNKVTVKGVKTKSMGLVRRRAIERTIFETPPSNSVGEARLSWYEIVQLVQYVADLEDAGNYGDSSLVLALTGTTFDLTMHGPTLILQAAVQKLDSLYNPQGEQENANGVHGNTEQQGVGDSAAEGTREQEGVDSEPESGN